MQALIIIDAQNEFSSSGKRPVPHHSKFIEAITKRVEQFRSANLPIAWVKHHNKPLESPAFVPGSWGADFVPGFGPKPGTELELVFEKNVYGVFTGTNIGLWLESLNVNEVLFVGFYTHGCLSTSAREAIMKDLSVSIDPNATGACDMENAVLGKLTADEVRRSALIQLASMGAIIAPFINN
ncbi:MAG TPA: isochorismatase family cysteine hydrolase [Chitinophagaceae bacterium]|nr:isochorismatase family cysteine hydrolase [Chitinophagaceae bacterium]